MVVRSEEKAKNVMFWLEKDISKVDIVPMDFAEYLREQFMVNFYKMDFMKGIVLLVKLDEICTVSWSPLATVYWSRDEIGMDDQSLFTGEMLIRLLCPSLSKGQTSSPKRYSCRERSGYCKIDDTEIR